MSDLQTQITHGELNYFGGVLFVSCLVCDTSHRCNKV